MAEILYGVRASDDKVITISDILNLPNPDSMRGEKCGCVCPNPNCRRPLIAKLGDLEKVNKEDKKHRKTPHFSHKANGEVTCDAAYANESALHLLAKEIIFEEHRFFAPSDKITWQQAGVEDVPFEVLEEIQVFCAQKGREVNCSNVVLEERVSDMVPDIVASTPQGEYLLEIFVTHPVTAEKKAKTARLHLPMLQIDLSDYANKDISKEELRQILMQPNKRTEWVYYQGKENVLANAKRYYRTHKKVQAYIEEQRKLQEAKQKWLTEEERKKREQRMLFRKRLTPENYASELKRLRLNDTDFLKFAQQRLDFFVANKAIPWFIDIPITGEIVFQCDRRVWQGIIFNRWIWKRKSAGCIINIHTKKDSPYLGIFDSLTSRAQENLRFDGSLLPKVTFETPEKRTFFFRNDVIQRYIDYLEKLGFIRDVYYERKQAGARAACTHTLHPQNEDYAKALRAALRKVDLSHPDVDRLIDAELAPFFRNKEEAVKRAKQLAKDQKAEEKRLRIENANYDQDDEPIWDSDDPKTRVRYMKCIYCEKKIPGFQMSKHVSLNRGVCRGCYRTRRK